MKKAQPRHYNSMPKASLVERILLLERVNQMQAFKLNEAGIEIPNPELLEAMKSANK